HLDACGGADLPVPAHGVTHTLADLLAEQAG
ncbi:MAG: hypothetical protein Q605_AUC01056G0002, partial [Actinomyces urogenitalis DORA_12]